MYTVLKDLAVNYVIFQGPPYVSDDYPDWFVNKVLPFIFEDDLGNQLLNDGDPDSGVSCFSDNRYYMGSKLEAGHDIFIMNPRGDVRRIDSLTFFEHFTEITEDVAALNKDVMRYTMYEGYGDIMPEWLPGAGNTDVTVMDTLMTVLNDINDDLLMSNVVVILLNDRDETHYMDVATFDELMVSSDFNRNYIVNLTDDIDVPYHDTGSMFEHLPW